MLLCHSSSEIWDRTVWTPLDWSSGPAGQRFLNRTEGCGLRIRKASQHPAHRVPRHESPTSASPPHPRDAPLPSEQVVSSLLHGAPASPCARPSPRQVGVLLTPILQVRTLEVRNAGYLPKGTLRGPRPSLGVPRALDDRLSLSCCKKHHRWETPQVGGFSNRHGFLAAWSQASPRSRPRQI